MSIIRAIRLWLEERNVRRRAERTAIELCGTGKYMKAQRERYVRGQVAIWKEDVKNG
mgnify:CR=1 FL=1